MTSLLAQVRNDPDVVKARKHLAHCLGPMRDPDAITEDPSFAFEGYNWTFLRAAVRELARRVRVERRLRWGAAPDNNQDAALADEWDIAADFVERQGDEQ